MGATLKKIVYPCTLVCEKDGSWTAYAGEPDEVGESGITSGHGPTMELAYGNLYHMCHVVKDEDALRFVNG